MVLEALIYLPFSEATRQVPIEIGSAQAKSTCRSLVIRSIPKESGSKYGLASLSTKTIGSMPEDQ